MTETLIVDYAWNGPPLDAVAGAGFVGIARYLSLDGTKNLTAVERDRAFALGLSVTLVWEAAANPFANRPPSSAGTIDGGRANSQADMLGVPPDRPLYYGIDFDVRNPNPTVQAHTLDAVTAYLQACGGPGRRPVGVYGSILTVDTALERGAAVFGWQTGAWSGIAVSQRAHLYQRVKKTWHPLAGDYDENVALRPDWGQWPAPAGVPGTAPTTAVSSGTQPSVFVGRFTTGGTSVGVYDVAVPLDAAGEGSAAVGPFDKLQSATAFAQHDKYDPATKDPDTIVPRADIRPSTDNVGRVVVAGGAPNSTATVRVVLAD